MVFLFMLIFISMFFASSPFAVMQNYNCLNQTISNADAKVCGTSGAIDGVTAEIKNSAIVSDGIYCLGENVTANSVTGYRFVIKRAGTSYYYNDCAISNAVCSSGRCVNYAWQKQLYSLVEGLGFNA